VKPSETCAPLSALRFRSVYLGLAKRRQRRKAQTAAKAKTSQAMTAALFQEQPKVGGSKSPE